MQNKRIKLKIYLTEIKEYQISQKKVIQKLEQELEKQNNTNESLVMKINEMASLDNILTTSIEEGLAYNNENIKTITE